MIKIDGLQNLSRQLSEFKEACAALEESIEIELDSLDPVGVELACAKANTAIDDRLARFAGNTMVIEVADQLKQAYRQKILDHVSNMRNTTNNETTGDELVHTTLSQIDDVIHDLQSSTFQTFERHIKRLAAILHSDELEMYTVALVSSVDVTAFLQEGHASQGGIVGSAILPWPIGQEEQIGLVIGLVDRFGADWNEAFNFSHTFYNSGSKFIDNLLSMVRQMLVPFARDYKKYIQRKIGNKSMSTKPDVATTVNQQFHFNNSTVGSVQTGSHAVANVVLQNNTQVVAELVKALDEVGIGLGKIAEIPCHDKMEVAELVEDGKDELAKPKPNMTKVRTFLAGIAAAISAVADMKPAYELLKVAALKMGIQLP